MGWRLVVLGNSIGLLSINSENFISLTDIARYKNWRTDLLIQNRMRNKETLSYLWLREKINNPNFKPLEFDGFIKSSWFNAFLMSPKKRVNSVSAIWMVVKSWINGGTFAHQDIAVEFASWLSVEFKLYLIKEFQRLKELESKSSERSVRRLLTKMNYRIHTDSIQNHLIPMELTPMQISFVYADEADMLNVAVFGTTAGDRKLKNPDLEWNMRDYATLEQLIILANCESVNAELIRTGMIQSERIVFLHRSSREQMKSLLSWKISLS
jgi:hypothetical protein